VTFRHPTITKGNANMKTQMVISTYTIQSTFGHLSVMVEIVYGMNPDGSNETYFILTGQDASANISSFLFDDFPDLAVGCLLLRHNFMGTGEVQADYQIDLVEGLEDASDE